MNGGVLRELAKEYQNIEVDPKKLIAAVLYHYVKPEDISGDYNFLWIKAHKVRFLFSG
jgi:hypothetical protein